MHATENNQRAGVDIRVALSSKAKLRSSEIREQVGPFVDHSAFDLAAMAPAGQFRSAVKRRLRPVARLAFKMVKIFARPIAFRLRAYLLGALQAETQQFHQRLAQEFESHRQAQFAAVDRLLTIHTSHVLQEIQAVRESLHRNQHREHPRSGESHAAPAASVHKVAFPLQPDALLVRTGVGPVLCPASDFQLVSTLMETGELERGTRLVIERLLGPEGTFIDAGAHIGMHTLAAARVVGEKGRIVTFEPVAATYDLLKKSVFMNGFFSTVEMHQAAVSNRAASSTSPGVAAVEVPVVRIDDIVGQAAKIDLIKIDVGGGELQAVEGAAETIARNPHIALIVKLDMSHLRKTRQTTSEWLGRFEELGLVHGAIDPRTGALRQISALELESSLPVDLLFARPGSAPWIRVKERHEA